MRVHITLDDALVSEIDRRVGVGRRSAYVATAVRVALDDEQRWELIESAIGAIGEDPARAWGTAVGEWVRAQRRSDGRRLG
ncbi:MAG: hypothetical protein HYX33_00970 [Actinobacteria bacterium]|nr:hypothetical protein [Actinomycetota bacterium]